MVNILRVMFLVYSLDGGGTEKVLSDIVSNMDKRKFEITVISVFDCGLYRDRIREHAYYKYFVKENKSNSLFLSVINMMKRVVIKYCSKRLIYKLFIKDKYDVEIAFSEATPTRIIAGSYNNKSKKYAWVHTDMLSNPYSEKYYNSHREEIECYKLFNKIICVSNTVRDSFVRKFGILDNVVTQYNPVDEKAIRQKALEVITDIQTVNKFRLISVGRLVFQKGYDRLLEIHKRLMEEGFDYELWILGEGVEEQSLRSFIEENYLQDSIKLLGFKGNPYKYLNACDLFVCSSRVEGFNLAVAEALLLSKPVISTNCAGPNELLDNGKYGFMVDNDTESLYKGLKSILSDSAIYEHYKQMAIKKSSFFNLEKTINEIEGLL